MAPLPDNPDLPRFRHALSQWKFTGYVTWKAIAREWVEKNIEGYSTRAIAEEMSRYVESGGKVDQVAETRHEWSEHRFHFDLRMPIAGKTIYIETILVEDDPDDPTIHIVSIHDV